ncbi:hypothetical protein [Paraflavitalea sp. CAU 1676]|uniref:hypothetical protein n=1 Tax=Paraflavitalea sp. CAU 1676 TaxID=3032598 RepID=UPI0023DB6BA9|nr:hypothetical protein [Paraflavitalea sp. CAU 1676]MDF2187828.1 hypothetical protein [Paraflavitalea sp. CAU 1676]
MKRSLFAASVIAASIVALTSCKKNQDAPQYARAEAFWAANKIPTQTFSGNAASGFAIIGEKGTKVNFPANAFVDGDGAIVSGTVTVTLKEVLSKKDVLLSGVMTESNGKLLESGGELEIKANKDGKNLRINPQLGDKGIQVEVPKVMNQRDMGLFVQEKRDPGPNGGGTGTGGGQTQQTPTTWVPAPYYPFGNGPNSYTFTLPGFTWVNCDRFYSDPNPKTTVTVSPVFQDNNLVSDLQVILVFKNISTVITFPYNNSIQKFESYQNSLPIGSQAHLVLIGKDSDGFIQFGTQSITISANQHIDAPIHKSTQAEVDAFLASIQ